jgi:CheY-like chemotaxis protein
MMNDILKNLTVLFVEDEEKIRTSMASVMEDVFKKVIVAGNGDEGLKKFKKYNPDLVITDITMPIMDGLEATTKIRALNRQDAKAVSIIAMTANAFAEDRSLSKSAGMNEHLSKPIEPQLLYKTLSDYIK